MSKPKGGGRFAQRPSERGGSVSKGKESWDKGRTDQKKPFPGTDGKTPQGFDQVSETNYKHPTAGAKGSHERGNVDCGEMPGSGRTKPNTSGGSRSDKRDE